ncbi:hypothetical protein ZOD2009_01480 [Haladaptatus paucihalophilus DX253]|uniref:Uncharacterized protein n=1 Tax=Haladaptatus paucihalophilus DX253 TaxID=797209 RepID=E7QMX8_HALPU|nr:hypothetical protein ZOD2009_01480 [Haladaptatus paucihalophilus DX253]
MTKHRSWKILITRELFAFRMDRQKLISLFFVLLMLSSAVAYTVTFI